MNAQRQPQSRNWVASILLATVGFVAYFCDLNLASEDVGALINTLRSDAPYMDKLHACKRLRQQGAVEAIPVLKELLLADENLSHAARLALEAMPDPSADQALLEALPQLDGKRRIGVIQSLGVRRTAEAVPALDHLLRDTDEATAAAAAEALGRIATPEAISALEASLGQASPTIQVAICRGLLESAESLVAQGEVAKALEIVPVVEKASVPEHIRLAATRLAIVHDQSARESRLRQLLTGEDGEFRLALEAARTLPRAQLIGVLANVLPSSPSKRQLLLLELIKDLELRELLPAALNLVNSEHEDVQRAAIRSLGKLGDARVLPALLTIAGKQESNLSSVARQSLAELSDPAVNQEILDQLAELVRSPDDPRLPILVELAGRRRLSEATPLLLTIVQSPNSKLRHEAIRSLGHVVPPSQVPALINIFLRPQAPEDRPILAEAIKSATIRAVDRETVAEAIVTSFPQAPAEIRPFLVEVLGLTNANAALRLFDELVWQEAYQDQVSKILGEWLNPAAAPLLLKVAEKSSEQRYRIRALRGYLRIARQFDVSAPERLCMLTNALHLAERPEEKELTLDGLVRMARKHGLDTTEGTQAPTQERAHMLVVTLAEKLAEQDPEKVRQALLLVAQMTKSTELQARAKLLAEKLAARRQ